MKDINGLATKQARMILKEVEIAFRKGPWKQRDETKTDAGPKKHNITEAKKAKRQRA